jgi:hypothetical protein
MSKWDGLDGKSVPKYHGQYADPSIFNKTRGRGVNTAPTWSVADEWSEKKLVEKETAVYWRAATNDEAMTVSRVREYLREDPFHRNPITGKMGGPRAYFIKRGPKWKDGCHEVITDIRAAKRVEVGMNADGTKQYGDERDDTIRDHLLDGVRYALSMRPSPSRKLSSDDLPPGHIRLKDYEDQDKWARHYAEMARLKAGVVDDYGY